ncbi:MAG TPA: hypothetical protein VFP43_10995, partial [Mesorhizobium sp.]|nr:hypothetical protein [Mesorhizobium sp.]
GRRPFAIYRPIGRLLRHKLGAGNLVALSLGQQEITLAFAGVRGCTAARAGAGASVAFTPAGIGAHALACCLSVSRHRNGGRENERGHGGRNGGAGFFGNVFHGNFLLEPSV